DEQIAFPFEQRIAGIERHARHRNGRCPVHHRRLKTFMSRAFRLPWAGVLAAQTHQRPAIVESGTNDVYLVAPVWSIFVLPYDPGSGMNSESKRATVTPAVHLGACIFHVDEGVVGRYRAIIIDANDL